MHLRVISNCLCIKIDLQDRNAVKRGSNQNTNNVSIEYGAGVCDNVIVSVTDISFILFRATTTNTTVVLITTINIIVVVSTIKLIIITALILKIRRYQSHGCFGKVSEVNIKVFKTDGRSKTLLRSKTFLTAVLVWN